MFCNKHSIGSVYAPGVDDVPKLQKWKRPLSHLGRFNKFEYATLDNESYYRRQVGFSELAVGSVKSLATAVPRRVSPGGRQRAN